MNRKHNPLVALAALILLAVILVAVCTGCTARATLAETKDKAAEEVLAESWSHGRIAVEKVAEEKTTDSNTMGVFIITDKDTNAQYMAVIDYASGGVGLIQLYNAPGVCG